MLTAFASYDDGHFNTCPQQDTVTVNSTVIKCSHNKGQNMPEEHTNEDDANAVNIHHSWQEASSHSTVMLPWTDESIESINCEMPFSNREQWLKMCQIPSNHTITELPALIYTNTNVQRDPAADNIHMCAD
jgi:hypothetical protein